MSASPVLDAFPRRPLRLATTPRRRKGRILGLVFSLLLALPAFYWGYRSWHSGQLRADLRERGVPTAEVLDSEGSCTSRRSRLSGTQTPVDCWFTLTYRLRPEEGGGTRTAQVHHMGRAPIFTPPARYDPADPGRVMLQPEIDRDMTFWEKFAPVFLLLLPAIALGIWFAAGRRGLAKAARDPKPLLVPIEKSVRQMPANRLFVHFRPPGAERPAVESFGPGEAPFLVRPPAGAPPDQQWALALAGAKRPYLLDEKLLYLDLGEAERAALRNAAWA